MILGFAGASFAVALPLASRWYPPEHQGKAMGLAGMGNSGTVLAALFAPILAKLFGWNAVLGLAVIPLTVVLRGLSADGQGQPRPARAEERSPPMPRSLKHRGRVVVHAVLRRHLRRLRRALELAVDLVHRQFRADPGDRRLLHRGLRVRRLAGAPARRGAGRQVRRHAGR